MNLLNKVIIFGATSGIAEHAIRQLIREGASVYCVARDAERLKALLTDLKVRANDSQIIDGGVYDLDNTDLHEQLWQEAKKALNGFDAVLLAQGMLPEQKLCEQSTSKTIAALHTNAIAPIHLLTLIAQDFAQQKKGVIAVISSVAGDRGRQSNYIYGSAKGMLSIFLQGLRNRLFKDNVSVVTIKPGFTRTKMTEGMKRDGLLWADAEEVAQGIVKAMRNGKDEVYLKSIWFFIMKIIKITPEFIFKRLSL